MPKPDTTRLDQLLAALDKLKQWDSILCFTDSYPTASLQFVKGHYAKMFALNVDNLPDKPKEIDELAKEIQKTIQDRT